MLTSFVQDDTVSPHFMGAVVLDQLRTPAGAMPARQVIDGPQRLTTLQVLLAAVRDSLVALGAADRYAHAGETLGQRRRHVGRPERRLQGVADLGRPLPADWQRTLTESPTAVATRMVLHCAPRSSSRTASSRPITPDTSTN